jgi:hypothetical protein
LKLRSISFRHMWLEPSFCYPILFRLFGFVLPKTFSLFGFPIVWLWAYTKLDIYVLYNDFTIKRNQTLNHRFNNYTVITSSWHMRVPLKMKGGASSTVIKIYLTNYEFIRGAIYVRRDIHTSELLSLNPDLYVFLCCRSFTSPLIILVYSNGCH